MKVVMAGYSKTGTKSMAAALRLLGYKVYDFMDHFWYHYEDWMKIMERQSTVEDFRRMYQDVDALTGCPAFAFWEEILKAFPDAKVVLTTREEESWYRSTVGQARVLESYYKFPLMQILTPTGRKYFKFYRALVRLCEGVDMKHPFHYTYHYNDVLTKLKYRQHQKYCEQNAPKDKLLVYSVKEGWGPLCAFLGKDVPSVPFPHSNVGGVYIEDLMEVHPAFDRMEREWRWVLFLLTAMGLYTSYKIYSHGWMGKAANFFSNFARRGFSCFHLSIS
ncbi:uncharacterized protein LOC143459192 isoform X2 [Clavelina lepadiformis]|uniref:uncharacterized protein LOC143459192 isoform X2 n=1 Tax=Clavelina lepadiformis TaxID=159417 RepID=UPI004041D76E